MPPEKLWSDFLKLWILIQKNWPQSANLKKNWQEMDKKRKNSKFGAIFWTQNTILKKKRFLTFQKTPLWILHAKFRPVWMKNPGVDRFFSIFQVRKYLISITFIPHEGFLKIFKNGQNSWKSVFFSIFYRKAIIWLILTE